jgi:hypothetical protein
MAAMTVGVFHQRSAGGLSPGGFVADVVCTRMAISRGPPLPIGDRDTKVDGALVAINGDVDDRHCLLQHYIRMREPKNHS